MQKLILRIDIVTLFPEFFTSPLQSSILRVAQEKGVVEIKVHNLRDYTYDNYKTCDDKPFGGGPGMVMKPEPIFECIEDLKSQNHDSVVIYLTPQGKPLNQGACNSLATLKSFILLCGHYEGIDQRVRDTLIDREVSIGDFVLTGGEVPALALVDSVVRLIPGVLGNDASIINESFQTEFLDYPHYTRPREYRGLEVPDVLLSGNHAKIGAWRKAQSIKNTNKRNNMLLGKDI